MTMLDKRMTPAEIVGQLSDGMTLGIGGWGPRRKPMALVREILRSDLKDLTIVAYGGADVGMLCAAGKVKKLVFAFVSLDAIPLEPWFRKAREAGQIEVLELDEGMFQWGLKAASFGLPFLPTRVGLGTDLAELGGLKTVQSPYADGEVLIAMPALEARCRAAPCQPQRLARQHPGIRTRRLLRRMVRPRCGQDLCFMRGTGRPDGRPLPRRRPGQHRRTRFISGVTHLRAAPTRVRCRQLMAGT
jgi:acyl CoA:acetate/3-ketoacid CoA transferase alpha subunit